MTSPQTYPQPPQAPERRAQVALDTPGLGPLDYDASHVPALSRGDWVLVPLGSRMAVGVVLGTEQGPGPFEGTLRPIQSRLDQIPPLNEPHLRLVSFVSRYYRRGLGTVLLAGLPAWLRKPTTHLAGPRRRAPMDRLLADLPAGRAGLDRLEPASPLTPAQGALTPEQSEAFIQIQQECERPSPRPVLIHGLTGTGKTRLYEAVMAERLARVPDGQVLVMVPEIGLTPQLLERLQRAFPGHRMAVLHSGLGERSRAQQWLLASRAEASIVLGTRLSVLCPLPRLVCIVVDEEHDSSFKQQEGLRYSARDLAVWLGQDRGIPVLLGSATPSLESWLQAQRGRYRRVTMRAMASGALRPAISLIDLVQSPPSRDTGLSSAAQTEILASLAREEQVLLYVNRRGWAPVLVCDACGWRADCPDCDVPSVLHRQRGRWRSICHHCGLSLTPPTACPSCGHQDLSTLGQGTQQLEQALIQLFPGVEIARMDRDEIQTPEALQALLQRVRAQTVSILVGTQMAAKGHDFERLRLVVVLDADAQLANPDFRGPEWLYAGIAQVAGRAGRHPGGGASAPARVLIQTRYPQHPVFAALTDPDPMRGIEAFWALLARERQEAGLPPFGSMALVRASHRDPSVLMPALKRLSSQLGQAGEPHGVRVSPPVPRHPERVAGRTRWQVVLEAPSRRALQGLLDVAEDWVGEHRARLHAQIEVDPLGLG